MNRFIYLFLSIFLLNACKKPDARFECIEAYDEYPCIEIDTPITSSYVTCNLKGHQICLDNFHLYEYIFGSTPIGKPFNPNDKKNAGGYGVYLDFETSINSENKFYIHLLTPGYNIDTPLYRIIDDFGKYLDSTSLPIEDPYQPQNSLNIYRATIWIPCDEYNNLTDLTGDYPLLTTVSGGKIIQPTIPDPDNAHYLVNDQYQRYIKLNKFERDEIKGVIKYIMEFDFDVNMYHQNSLRHFGQLNGSMKVEFEIIK